MHMVRITKPFEIGKYEVTQELWQSVMGNNPSHFKGADMPVEMVSWNEQARAAGDRSFERGYENDNESKPAQRATA